VPIQHVVKTKKKGRSMIVFLPTTARKGKKKRGEGVPLTPDENQGKKKKWTARGEPSASGSQYAVGKELEAQSRYRNQKGEKGMP